MGDFCRTEMRILVAEETEQGASRRDQHAPQLSLSALQYKRRRQRGSVLEGEMQEERQGGDEEENTINSKVRT